jgi:hypothetical protein
MSISRTRLLVASALMAGVTSAAMAAALSLHAETGLWEISSKVKIGGMQAAMASQMSQANMAHMPPEARAQMQAAMASMDGVHTNKTTSCLTKEELDRPFHPEGHEPGENCKETVISASATDEQVNIVCTGNRSMQGTVHFAMSSPTTMHGHMQMNAVQDGHPMNIETELDGRWLGADCSAKHG